MKTPAPYIDQTLRFFRQSVQKKDFLSIFRIILQLVTRVW